MDGELGLVSAVLEDGRFHIRQYGHLVYTALKENRKEDMFMACLFASNYWRIIGKPAEAIDCQKKALHLAPQNWKFSALLSMANVLHRAHHSDDAVILLLRAIQITPDNPAIYFTLGNIQATLLNFNESAANFAQAIKLQPNFEAAKKRRHAIICHQKIEQTLEYQQQALQETLKELRHYKKQHDIWTELLNKIMIEQASFDTRMQTTIGYEHAKLRLRIAESEKRRRSKFRQNNSNKSKWNVNHQGDCDQNTDEEGHIYLTCGASSSDGNVLNKNSASSSEHGLKDEYIQSDAKIIDDHLYTNAVDLLLKKFEARINEIKHGPATAWNAESGDDDIRSITLVMDHGIRPTLSEKYTTYPDETDGINGDDKLPKYRKGPMFWLKKMYGEDWPTKEICKKYNLKKDWFEYPTVFLSPENKGFE